MAYRRHALEAGGDDEGLVGEPLLESTWSPPRAHETLSSIDSMPWSHKKAVWSGSTTVTTSSDDGTELALESLGNSQDLDSTNLRAQGHEAALKRSFSLLSALGLGFSITSSWVGYLSNFGQNLIYGGPRVVVFGLLIATVVQCGQYHFTFILAPGPHKRFAAFVVGWMTLLGWWIVTSSGISLCAVFVAGLVSFWDETFEATSWQIYLLFLATIVVTSSPLFLCPRMVPKITRAALFLAVTGFFVVFGLVLGLRRQTQPASFITQSGLGTSGWNAGTAWVLGVGNALYAYGGIDAAIHIAEEIPQPDKNIPQAMNLTVLIGFVTAFPMSLALMFSMKDMDSIINSKLPSAELFYQITGSRIVVTIIMDFVDNDNSGVYEPVGYLRPYGLGVCSRRTEWSPPKAQGSVADKDLQQGIPYSKYFAHVSPSLDFPVRATVLSMTFCGLYGLIYLASSTAFNSIITSAVLYLSITYAIPQGIILTRGRETALPARAWNLGKAGYICNILSPLLVTVIGTCLCFPPQLPVTSSNANYTPAILFALFTVVLCLWYARGHKFMGPKIDWELLNLTACR
ncbi:MAG: hypothetical protein LQ345_000140 [Seirophora villosa]|nr:MAG: hypothetical protein LQ345_000140 [Seirophora villosa]